MHSKNVIYRDLKPENLLIGPDGYLKLADFGFAKILKGRTYTLCGTPNYLAPEILKNKGHGKGVDWWTVGVLIYEIIAGIDPFNAEDPMQIYQKILSGKIRFTRRFNKAARSLVKHLLQEDLSKRYGNLKNGAEDLKNHRFFDKIDFEEVWEKRVKAEYKPVIRSLRNADNFEYIEEEVAVKAKAIPEAEDPFLGW